MDNTNQAPRRCKVQDTATPLLEVGASCVPPALHFTNLAFVKGVQQPGSFDDVIVAANLLCQAIDRGHIVDRRTKLRLALKCSCRNQPSLTDTPCPFYIGCKQSGGQIRFTTLRLDHKCKGNVGRRRGVKTTVLKKLSIHIDAFTVSKSWKGGNAAQLQQTLRVSSGLNISKSQAHLIVTSKKGTIATHLAQFELLPSWVRYMDRIDPVGTYVLKTTGMGTDESPLRFVSLFIAPSAAKKNAKYFERVASVDCAHLRSVTKGQMCSLIGYDANRHIMPFCFAIFKSEDAKNWGMFMSWVFILFPHVKCIISDGSKGLESLGAQFTFVGTARP